MGALITLTTDFGLADGYVAAMKGVILGINPDATIVDITHEIEPQNIRQGAMLFASAALYFPPGSIHVVVVDPGVGSERRPLALLTGQRLYVAPDNGVLTRAVEQSEGDVFAVQLDRPQYWLSEVSSTFHGRDIFAPVAAHLSLGVPLGALGKPIADWVRLPPAAALRGEDGSFTARIAHIDRFGNVVIELRPEDISIVNPDRVSVTVAGRRFKGLKQTYTQAGIGEIILVANSSGFLEIAQNRGNAARTLGVSVGDPVIIVP